MWKIVSQTYCYSTIAESKVKNIVMLTNEDAGLLYQQSMKLFVLYGFFIILMASLGNIIHGYV